MARRIKDPELRAYLKQVRAEIEAEAGQIAPAPVHGDVGRRVRNALVRIVCSWRWEQDVVDEMNASHLPVVEATGPLRRVLFDTRFYPPGGPETKMQPCLICGRDLPPQIVGSIGVCYECFKERQVTCYLHGRPIDPDRLVRMYTAGKITRKEFEDALQPLERVITEPSRYHVGLRVKREDVIAVMGFAQQFRRSRGRSIFLADDPAVRGGKLDADTETSPQIADGVSRMVSPIVEPWGGGGGEEAAA